MIEVKNLTKRYGDHTVVNHLSFTIEPGKIYGFLGPNGAGKSTTMNMITGCLAPTDGQVLIDGHDIQEDAVAAKRKIGYLPEIPPVYPDMTPEEYLSFVAAAKGIRSAAIAEQVFRVMEETDILDMRNRLIKNLSKGYKQRVGIAQAMLGDPQLIILDEPTVGLDPRQITEIRELILRLGKTRTIILSSHILAEVQAVCDHVMIINRGNLVASDTLENIRRENTPDNRINLTVRANPQAIEEILRTVSQVLSFDIVKNDSEPNLYDVSVEVEEDTDIREKLFFAFADKRYAVRRLAKAELSLEEIFLMLTEAVYTDEDGEDEEADDADDYEDEDDDDDEEDGYKPLFGGSARKEEDDQ
ncbi:MAG: ABC transporter ATP-binding protein [Clostridia bacterium]|nr:ABC transporter ATP-binding protein [Clostridia bacterium]